MNREAGNTIRVLIVDDIPETRENLKKLLFFETDIEVVDTATSGEEAVECARELRPDIILMDINMPGLDGISAGEMITKDVPQAQIIMMSVQGEADYLRRSMLAGAREFLIKPFSSEELVSTIRRVYDLGAPQRAAAAQAPAPTAQNASHAGAGHHSACDRWADHRRLCPERGRGVQHHCRESGRGPARVETRQQDIATRCQSAI